MIMAGVCRRSAVACLAGAKGFERGGIVIWLNEAFSTGTVEAVSADTNADPIVRHTQLHCQYCRC